MPRRSIYRRLRSPVITRRRTRSVDEWPFPAPAPPANPAPPAPAPEDAAAEGEAERMPPEPV